MDQARLTRWVLWGALLASVVIYGALPFVISVAGEAGEADVLAAALGAVALAAATASFLLKRRLVSEPLARREIDPGTTEGAQRLQIGYVVTWVCAEAVGIFGLVLFFVSHQARLALIFVAASAVLMLIHAPRDPGLAPISTS